MFASFVVMLREGIEAALILGIILIFLERTQRSHLKRAVFFGAGWAILASILAAGALNSLPINEEAYEGVLYWLSAVIVGSVLWWMYQNAGRLEKIVEAKVDRIIGPSGGHSSQRERFVLGLFAFMMVFREGAETVMLLSAVRLNTDAMMSFLGTILGLIAVIIFTILFIRGHFQTNLQRFFKITGWILGIFIIQLVINGYHEFSEAGIMPATQTSMAVVGPVVRHNTLFIIALLLMPLFLWATRQKTDTIPAAEGLSDAQQRLAVVKKSREVWYGRTVIGGSIAIAMILSVVYVQELLPKEVPLPASVSVESGAVRIPVSELEDGMLHRFGLLIDGRMVRFLAMKIGDEKYKTAFDACLICGSFGYIQSGHNLLCLNCAAEILPATLGMAGGCNPIPLESWVDRGILHIALGALRQESPRFHDQGSLEQTDPVCGMRLKISESSAFETYNNKIYYFCAMPNCHRLFKENPAAFAR